MPFWAFVMGAPTVASVPARNEIIKNISVPNLLNLSNLITSTSRLYTLSRPAYQTASVAEIIMVGGGENFEPCSDTADNFLNLRAVAS